VLVLKEERLAGKILREQDAFSRLLYAFF